MAREMAATGGLDPVTETLLTTPLSRRALLLSPVVLGLGLAAAPRVAEAFQFDQWVQYSYKEAFPQFPEILYYNVYSRPESDGLTWLGLRDQLTGGRWATYGNHWTNWFKVYFDGEHVGNWMLPNMHTEGKIPNKTWINGPGSEAHSDFWFKVRLTPGRHTIGTYSGGNYCNDGAAGAEGSFTIDIPYTGRVTVDVRPLAFGNAESYELSSGWMPEGTYELRCAGDAEYSLNVEGGSPDSGANVWVYQTNLGDAASDRLWDLFRLPDGSVRLQHHASTKFLDLTGGTVAAQTNVQQWEGNSGDAQRWWMAGSWSLTGREALEVLLACDRGYALDVANGTMANGTNVQLYTRNHAKAQGWVPVLLNPDESGTWAEVSELPDAPIPRVPMSGVTLGLYLGDTLLETKTLSSPSATHGSVTFDTVVQSGTADWYNVRVLDSGAQLRRPGRLHRFYVRGDCRVNVWMEYARHAVTYKSVDEDGAIRTLADGTRRWPYDVVADAGELTEALGVALGFRADGGGRLFDDSLLSYWYDRDPMVAAARRYDLSAGLEMDSDKVLWMRLPDTVTVCLVSRAGTEELVSTRAKDGIKVSAIDGDGDVAKATLKALGGRSLTAKSVSWWYANEACDSKADSFTVRPHTRVYVKLEAVTVTYVVDGRTMASDLVEIQDEWEIPAERTAQAARENCTPGFSGWFLDKDDPALTSDGPSGDAGLATVDVRADLTLYGVNRATVSFAQDPDSMVDVTTGEVRVGPQDSDAEATVSQRGTEDAIVRRVGAMAALPALGRLYRKTDAGRYVTCIPHAWHVTPGSASDSSTLMVSRDVTVYVGWHAGTTDGVAAYR